MNIKQMRYRSFVGKVYHAEELKLLSDVLITPLGCVRGDDFIKGVWKVELFNEVYLGSYDGNLLVINGYKWLRLGELYERIDGAVIEYEPVIGGARYRPLANVVRDKLSGVLRLAGWLDKTWIWGVEFSWQDRSGVYGGLTNSGSIIIPREEISKRLSGWKVITGEEMLQSVISSCNVYRDFCLPIDNVRSITLKDDVCNNE